LHGLRADDEEAGVGYYSGRVAVVTGAGSGIGRALAVALARQGAQLGLADRDREAVMATARLCPGGTRVRADAVDVTDSEAVREHSAAVVSEFGGADLVFAVAGMIHTGSLLASEPADLSRVIDVNLLGTLHTAKAFLPVLVLSGRGHLVTFSSGFGLMAAPHYSAYSASKFAVRGFSEALRQEMARDRQPVAVTCVYPGRIRTPIMRNGSYAAGVRAEAVAAAFDRAARMGPDQAAAVILRGVARRRAQLLVGADARAVSALVRATGSRYQDLLPVIARWSRRGIKRKRG
jgi:NAD(P)-dependent dehydrogenase (short-subunit alcohol dehydrogenase family)